MGLPGYLVSPALYDVNAAHLQEGGAIRCQHAQVIFELDFLLLLRPAAAVGWGGLSLCWSGSAQKCQVPVARQELFIVLIDAQVRAPAGLLLLIRALLPSSGQSWGWWCRHPFWGVVQKSRRSRLTGASPWQEGLWRDLRWLALALRGRLPFDCGEAGGFRACLLG